MNNLLLEKLLSIEYHNMLVATRMKFRILSKRWHRRYMYHWSYLEVKNITSQKQHLPQCHVKSCPNLTIRSQLSLSHNRVCYFSFLFVRLNQSSLTKAPSQRYLKTKIRFRQQPSVFCWFLSYTFARIE